MDVRTVALSQLCEDLERPEWNGPIMFIGDVGGTSARLGFARQGRHNAVTLLTVRFYMKKKDVGELLVFFRALLEAVSPRVVARVVAGVINVPGPVTGGVVGGPFNNLKGLARLADYPQTLFPPGRSFILNDIEAAGFGVLAISDAHVFSEYFELMWEGTQWRQCEERQAGSDLGHGRCIVLAQGTGLGSSLIHYNVSEKQFIVLPLELGSQTLSMRDDIEYIQATAAKLGRLPNFEDMVSGNGLERHYQHVVGGRKPPQSAEQIAQLVRQGDVDAIKAMKMFNKYLMRISSEASMALLPITIVVIGDNMVHNSSFYENPENIKEMRCAALDHAMERFGFQSRVTYLRQKKLLNLNLVGCYRRALDFGTSGWSGKSKL